MNIRKIVTIILALSMCLFVVVGCQSEDDNYTIVDEITIDFPVTDLDNDIFKVQYATDTWTYSNLIPGVTTFMENATLENEAGSNNVNFVLAGKTNEEINQNFVDEVIKEMQEAYELEGISWNVTELQKLGEETVFYVEQEVAITDAMIDAMLESSDMMTEEMLELLGGREELKKVKTSQMVYYMVINNNLTVITGTHFDENSKSVVLDAMKLIAQTLEIK